MIIECCQSMKKDFLDNCLQMVTVFVYRRNQLKVEKRWMQSTVSRIQAPASLIQVVKIWPSRLKPHPQDFLSDLVDWYTNIVDWIIKVCYNPVGWTSKSSRLECPCFEFCSSQPFQNLKFKKPNSTPIKYQHFT